MDHSEGHPIRPVYSLKTVVLVLLRLAVFTYGQEIDPCPYGWKLHGDNCYRRMGTGTMSLESAYKTCSQFDAHIIEPRSPEENGVVKEMLSGVKVDSPWLGGMQNSSSPYNWHWFSDKTVMTWTYWYKNADGDSWPTPEWGDCLVLWNTLDTSFTVGTWINDHCYNEHSVICQKEKDGGKDKTAGDQKAGDQKAGDQKTEERKTGEADNTVEENTTAGNSTNNSSVKLSTPSFLMSVCLSAVAMMKVF